MDRLSKGLGSLLALASIAGLVGCQTPLETVSPEEVHAKVVGWLSELPAEWQGADALRLNPGALEEFVEACEALPLPPEELPVRLRAPWLEKNDPFLDPVAWWWGGIESAIDPTPESWVVLHDWLHSLHPDLGEVRSRFHRMVEAPRELRPLGAVEYSTRMWFRRNQLEEALSLSIYIASHQPHSTKNEAIVDFAWELCELKSREASGVAELDRARLELRIFLEAIVSYLPLANEQQLERWIKLPEMDPKEAFRSMVLADLQLFTLPTLARWDRRTETREEIRAAWFGEDGSKVFRGHPRRFDAEDTIERLLELADLLVQSFESPRDFVVTPPQALQELLRVYPADLVTDEAPWATRGKTFERRSSETASHSDQPGGKTHRRPMGLWLFENSRKSTSP